MRAPRAVVLSVIVLLFCGSAARACFRQIAWMAVLSSPTAKSSAGKEFGTAQMLFDYQQPFGTLTVKTKNVRDVQSIELRRVRRPGDMSGPVVAHVYEVGEGPYHGTVSKLLRQSDVIPLAHPINDGYDNLADELVHRCIVVAVCTKTHPRGEVVGLITGRLVVTYSADGSFHDPKLHHQLGAGGI